MYHQTMGRGLVAIVIALGLTVSSPASADEVDPVPKPVPVPVAKPKPKPKPKPWERGVSDADKAAARKLTSEGVKAAGDSRWPQAAAKFKKAVGHWNHPRIHYNLIEPLVMLDKPLEADTHLAKALAFGREGLGADKYRDALVQQKQLAGRIATLTIVSKHPGAKVSLDGKVVFTAPGKHSQKITPGSHVVVASKPGYYQTTRSLVLVGGKQITESLTLIKVTPGKTIYKRRFRGWVPWTFVGSGVALGAVGLGLRTLAKSNLDQYDTLIQSMCDPSCSLTEIEEHRHLDERSGLYNGMAIASFGIAGGLVLTGLTLAIINSPRAVGVERPANKKGPRVTPGLSRSGGSVRVSWSF